MITNKKNKVKNRKKGNIFALGDEMNYLKNPLDGVTVSNPLDMNSIVNQGTTKLNSLAKSTGAFDGNSAVSASTSGLSASGAMGIASGAINIGSDVFGNMKVPKVNNVAINANSNDDIASAFDAYKPVSIAKNNVMGSALKDGMAGASAGAALGPIGIGVGAGIGLLAGGISSIFGNKARDNREQALRQQQLGNFNAQINKVDINNSNLAKSQYFADGGFTGLQDGNYTKTYLNNLNALVSNPDTLSRALTDLKPTGYINSKEDLLKYAQDKNVGKVHEYVNAATITPKPTRVDYLGDFPDPNHNNYLRPIKLSDVMKARATDPNAYKGFEASTPTGDMFAEGGNISSGTNAFSNGVTAFNTGNTHEQNPLGGIPQGIGQNGKPNLVEEGEVKYNDYIYSNRLTPTDKLLEEVGLPNKFKNKTFGDIAKVLSKESDERPNDPISKNGLDDSMNKLKQAQEILKTKKTQRQQNAAQIAAIKQGQIAQPAQPVAPQQDPTQQTQQPQEMAKGGQVSKGDSPQGIEPNMQQIIQEVSQWIQQGMSPQQVIRQLVTAGIPQQQAMQLVQQVSQQVAAQGQQQGGGQGLQVPQQGGQPQGQPQMMAFGGNIYATQGQMDYLNPPALTGIDIDKYAHDQSILGNSLGNRAEGATPIIPDINGAITKDASRVTYGQNIATPPTNPSFLNDTNMGYARFIPTAASGIATLTDALGVTNKPDYTAANTVAGLKVKGQTIGNYLGYTPMDRDYYINKLNANAGATRSGLANASGGNRATYAAGLLSADNNYNEGLGSLAQKAEEYNLGQRQRVEDFNRGTNQFNAQQSNWEQGINNEMAFKSAMLKDQAKSNSNMAKNTNRNNFIGDLGNIGKEAVSREMIASNPALYYKMLMDGQVAYKNKKKNGGPLKTKKGLDYGF